MAAGQCFGEMALVVDTTRFASVVTSERSLFLLVSKQHFQTFLGVAPPLEKSVARPVQSGAHPPGGPAPLASLEAQLRPQQPRAAPGQLGRLGRPAEEAVAP